MASTGTSLASLAALLRDGENVISPHVIDSEEEPALGALAAAGPRAAEAPEEYLLLVEAIREGYLLHYERPRVIQGADSDLRLLAGDYLYALGLSRLAALGDLPAVRQLADVIALSAQAHAGAEPPPGELPEAIWALGALGVAGGPWPEGEAAKQALRAERPGAVAEALEAASRRASELGIALGAQHALIAFKRYVLSNSTST
jgi:hypothetical protein